MRPAAARWALTIAGLAGLSIAAFLLRRADLADPPLWLPRCLFHEATGWHCPGCGNTRAASALLHGDLSEALRQNALFVLVLPFLGFLAWRSWMGWVYPGRLRPLSFRWSDRHTFAVVGFLLVYWVVRNLPWCPFAWLAPDPPRVRALPAAREPAAQPPDAPPPSSR